MLSDVMSAELIIRCTQAFILFKSSDLEVEELMKVIKVQKSPNQPCFLKDTETKKIKQRSCNVPDVKQIANKIA